MNLIFDDVTLYCNICNFYVISNKWSTDNTKYICPKCENILTEEDTEVEPDEDQSSERCGR